MSENQKSNIKQNPDRWNGFVFIAWAIAIVAWIFGGYVLKTTKNPAEAG